MSRPAALGFDVGTTAVKAGLLWLDADEPMVVVSHAYPTSRPRPGWAEQDPAAWIDGMRVCWEELRAAAGPVELRSVGVCSQVNTHLLADADLQPIRPAITWQDTRAAAEAAELDASASDRREALWGGPFTIDPSFSLARLAWLERAEPEIRAAGRWLLLPRDYCVAALTGEIVADPLSPVGLVGSDGAYLDGVLDLVPGAAELLPPIRRVDTAAGVVRSPNPVGLPAGVPVAVGTMDAWGSIFGAGLLRPGRGMDVAGTSEIVGVSSTRTVPTQGIVSFPPFDGVHIHAGPTQAGGSALDWAVELFGISREQALVLAASASDDPQPVVFLPHLAGERAPYWDPTARGMFIGMTTETTTGHMILAVLEGVAYAVRMLVERCEAAAGTPADAVRLCGGGARSELWDAIKASVLRRPVDLLETLEAGVLGAAVLGLVAATDGDLAEHLERHVRIARRIEPDASSRGRHDVLYGVYVESYRALEPLFPKLAPS